MPEIAPLLQNRQHQTLQLALNKLQGLELLHLSRLELEQRMNAELAGNPLLEEPESSAAELPETPTGAPETDDEEFSAELAAENDVWHDTLPLPPAPGVPDPDALIPETPAPPPDLAELLTAEVEASALPARLRELARLIISELDESGYLRTPLADLAMSADAELPELEAALAYVQSLDPPGVGARDLAECLRLQLERQGQLTPLLEQLLATGLDDLAGNRLPALAKKLKITVAQLQEAVAQLRKLDPAPGGRISRRGVQIITPEMEISPDGDRFAVKMLKKPRELRLAPAYVKMLQDPGLSAEDRAFLNDKYRRAKEFLSALAQRGSTLQRLGELIAGEQADFMRRGVAALKPMTMKQAGNALQLHETTISRAAANKYVLTPQGLYPLKYFFTSGFETGSGTVSSRAVSERIRELIAAEDPIHPLSDDKLAELLKQQGTPVARRTVAKYREALKIPPTNLRRRHQ